MYKLTEKRLKLFYRKAPETLNGALIRDIRAVNDDTQLSFLIVYDYRTKELRAVQLNGVGVVYVEELTGGIPRPLNVYITDPYNNTKDFLDHVIKPYCLNRTLEYIRPENAKIEFLTWAQRNQFKALQEENEKLKRELKKEREQVNDIYDITYSRVKKESTFNKSKRVIISVYNTNHDNLNKFVQYTIGLKNIKKLVADDHGHYMVNMQANFYPSTFEVTKQTFDELNQLLRVEKI